MIKIEFQEAFVFDILSINEVKMHYSGMTKGTILEFDRLYTSICGQLGKETTDFILASEEYNDLYYANEYVFRLVDAAKLDKIKASEVDKGNYQRFLAKQILQKKFFNNELTEVKIGYK